MGGGGGWEGRKGKYRSLRVDGVPDADQDQLPLPGFDSGRAAGAGPGVVHGFGPARGDARHKGMAVILLQGADARPGDLPRARHLYSVDEDEEYLALDPR